MFRKDFLIFIYYILLICVYNCYSHSFTIVEFHGSIYLHSSHALSISYSIFHMALWILYEDYGILLVHFFRIHHPK